MITLDVEGIQYTNSHRTPVFRVRHRKGNWYVSAAKVNDDSPDSLQVEAMFIDDAEKESAAFAFSPPVALGSMPRPKTGSEYVKHVYGFARDLAENFKQAYNERSIRDISAPGRKSMAAQITRDFRASIKPF